MFEYIEFKQRFFNECFIEGFYNGDSIYNIHRHDRLSTCETFGMVPFDHLVLTRFRSREHAPSDQYRLRDATESDYHPFISREEKRIELTVFRPPQGALELLHPQYHARIK